MHDSIAISACFSSGDRPASSDEPAAAAIRSSGHHHQSSLASVYRAKIAGRSRLVTVTWCKNHLLLRGLSVSIQEVNGQERCCKIELKPWHFWRKQRGERRLELGGGAWVTVAWDLRAARFGGGESEPRSGYYVAVVSGGEVSLLVGDMKKDAYRRTGRPPSLLDPVLVSRTENLFGRRKFSTRARFGAEVREIEIVHDDDDRGDELEVRIDGEVALRVERLHWKFRGNELVRINNGFRVEVFWDVHDWLFASGTRHGMFIFSPLPSSSSRSSCSCSSSSSSSSHGDHKICDHGDRDDRGSSRFSLFVYAWKVE